MSNPTPRIVRWLLIWMAAVTLTASYCQGQDTPPTSQPAEEPTTQATSQPAEEPTTQATSQPAEEPTTQAASQPAEDTLFGLAPRHTEHYTIYSQLSEEATADLALRLEAMYGYYATRFADCYSPIAFPMVAVLFNNRADFVAAGGHEFMPGQFMSGHDGYGARLMMIFHEGNIGAFLSSCSLMYHEGFHQFASIEISQAGNVNRQWPLWLDEAYATTFNNLAFTGDGWVDGIARAEYVQSAMDSREQFIPLRDLVNVNGRQWMHKASNGTVWPLYMEGWMLIHFLNHADDGRYRALLADYVRQTSSGLDSAGSLRRIVALQRQFSRWLQDNVHLRMTGAKYFEIFTATATSLVARAHARGQRFDSAEDFLQAVRSGTLNLPPVGDDQWLPDSLRQEVVWLLDDVFQPFDISLVYPTGDRPPTVRVAQPKYDLVLKGQAEVDEAGKVLGVRVDYVRCPSLDLDVAETMVRRRADAAHAQAGD